MNNKMSLNKDSLSDQISRELRQRIVNVEIDQGEKINVSALEEEFKVSRAPIREALQSLVDEGLVEVKPRVGYFAVELEKKQIEDICELRKLLETFALETSIEKISEEKLIKIYSESIRLRKGNLSKIEKRDKFDKSDEELHKLIIQNSGNIYLNNFAKRIHNLIALTRHLNERIDEAVEEHISIIKAMKNEKKKEAKALLTKHLDNVESEIISQIE